MQPMLQETNILPGKNSKFLHLSVSLQTQKLIVWKFWRGMYSVNLKKNAKIL